MSKILKATHEGILPIGDTQIRCYVLEDGRRVLSGRTTTKSLGLMGRGQGMRRIVESKSLKPYLTNSLRMAITDPIEFRAPSGGWIVYGYEATVLPEICKAVLQARDDGRLQPHQSQMALKCDMLLRALATVGIIALVDEATGYQEIRDRIALQKILEKYIAKELRSWVKTFPDEFYENLFRLRGWQYKPLSVKRPSYVGKLTNEIIYERLAPGVLQELQRITPKDQKGRRKHHFHRRLTEDIGHPKLREHLSNIIVLMKASSTWRGFYRSIQRALPKFGHTYQIPFEDEYEGE